jgi:uncharacterized DUF497 family protein
MIIVWDEVKRRANLEKHGLDFAELDEAFFLPAIIEGAKSGRFKAIGTLNDQTLAVIFLRLGMQGISVISMRPASKYERRKYR